MQIVNVHSDTEITKVNKKGLKDGMHKKIHVTILIVLELYRSQRCSSVYLSLIA